MPITSLPPSTGWRRAHEACGWPWPDARLKRKQVGIRDAHGTSTPGQTTARTQPFNVALGSKPRTIPSEGSTKSDDRPSALGGKRRHCKPCRGDGDRDNRLRSYDQLPQSRSGCDSWCRSQQGTGTQIGMSGSFQLLWVGRPQVLPRFRRNELNLRSAPPEEPLPTPFLPFAMVAAPPWTPWSIDTLCINSIPLFWRFDAVNKANSATQGAMAPHRWLCPLGKVLSHNPENPNGSTVIASCLSPATAACCSCPSPILTGYRERRPRRPQAIPASGGSKTRGHSETFEPGVEVTTARSVRAIANRGGWRSAEAPGRQVSIAAWGRSGRPLHLRDHGDGCHPGGHLQ